ncbi:MAG: hypothetical protein AB7O38_14495 [Pirellulaceae bacterium]
MTHVPFPWHGLWNERLAAQRGRLPKRVRRNGHHEVANGHVQNARDDQIGRDEHEPSTRDVGAESSEPGEDRDADDHLDDADGAEQ